MSERGYEFHSNAIALLERALTLSRKLRDRKRTHQVASAIFLFEKDVIRSEAPGLIGFSYRTLLLPKSPCAPEDMRRDIIGYYEERLSEYADPESEGFAHLLADRVTHYLVHWYTKKKDKIAKNRVLHRYADAFEFAAEKAEPLLAHGWLTALAKVMSAHGLKERVAIVERKLRELGGAVKESMGVISYEIPIEKSFLEELYESMLQDDAESTLSFMALQVLPQKKALIEHVARMEDSTPLLSFLPQQLIDDRGMSTINVRPGSDEALMMSMINSFQIWNWILSEGVSRFQDAFPDFREKTLQFLVSSGVFAGVLREPLERALKAFWDKDWVCWVHVVIPVMEAGFRRFVTAAGSSYFTQREGAGLIPRVLNDLLRDPEFERVVQDESVGFYCRAVLSEKVGYNLRNRIMHGEYPEGVFNEMMSSRLFHVLLLFGLFKVEKRVKVKGGAGK